MEINEALSTYIEIEKELKSLEQRRSVLKDFILSYLKKWDNATDPHIIKIGDVYVKFKYISTKKFILKNNSNTILRDNISRALYEELDVTFKTIDIKKFNKMVNKGLISTRLIDVIYTTFETDTFIYNII